MRALASLALFSALLAVVAATTAAAPAQDTPPTPAPAGEALFVLTGRGYGHGVGMSQYGMYRQAKLGRTYEQILTYYYTGVTLGPAPKATVRVLLAEGRSAVTVSSASPITAVDASGARVRLPAGAYALRPNLELTAASGKTLTAKPPLLLRPVSGAQLSLDGRPYRGTLELALQSGRLRVVNVVTVENYLLGVVAGEVPYTWPLEALKAQAVAARSYALANLVTGKPFDLYADVRSQVYLGVSGEQASTTQAVRATKGQVVLYEGKVASTLYHSTSGGRTASAADVFGSAVPYLVSKPDPWDKESPYHRWGPIVLSARAVQSQLGVSARVLDLTGVATPSRRLKSLVVTTPGGAQTLPAALLRSGLGLRSTWVTIGVLRVDRPRSVVTFGETVKIGGLARGVTTPVLAMSVNGKTWARVGALTVAKDGTAELAVKPSRTARYRIEAAGASSPALLVRVAPRIELAPSPDDVALVGTVRPKLQGAAVAVERRQGARWVAFADTTVDRDGSFAVPLGAPTGSYRARVAASRGYAEAVTGVVTVSP